MKPITKKEFKKKVMALELLPNALSKTEHPIIDTRIYKEVMAVRTKMTGRSSKRLSWQDLYKLYLVADFPCEEINHWVMRGNEIYRKKNVKWMQTARRRRSSIYDPYGNIVPRAFIDKHLPDWVKTQTDYDKHMSTKRR